MCRFVLALVVSLIPSLATAQPPTPCAAGDGVWVITTIIVELWVCASDGLSWVTLSSQGGDMLKSENLSGLANYSTARSNLGLGTAAITATTDYATAAQGTTANSALQPAGNGSALTGLTKTQVGLANAENTSDASKPVSTATQTALDAKQATLVSATNIKTINGSTVLGAGDLTVGGAVAWGGITGTPSNQTDLQALLDAKASTAHAASHVTGGSDIVANAVAAGNAGLLTGADKTKLDAQSGTNTGNQTSIVGITGSLTEFNTALTSADFATGGGTATGTNTGDQTTVSGNAGSATVLQNARTINGTSFDGSTNITLGNGSVTLAQQADVATASVFYRKTAATGVPEVQTLATLKTDLGLTGTNSGDQTITLTGDVTGTGTGSFATAIKASVSLTTPVLGVATGTSFAATGAITSSGTAGVGYIAGAGGAVTQATSKATGVTLNKITGAITMHAAALAAAAIVSFTFTNSTIAALDQVICTHQSAGTNGAYLINARPAAGSASIAVRNTTAGSLSEAIVIRCSVYKAVSS